MDRGRHYYTCPYLQTCCEKLATGLEVEAVDIILSEGKGRAKQDFAAIDDLKRTELASLNTGITGLELAIDHCTHDVNSGVAQINRIPKDDGLDAVGLNEGLHGVRCSQTNNRDLTAGITL